MENKFMKFVNDNKGFVVFYLIWFFLHLIFLLVNWHERYQESFWPFGKDSEFRDYDFTEFTFYIITPIIIFIIWKLIGKDIKKSI